MLPEDQIYDFLVGLKSDVEYFEQNDPRTQRIIELLNELILLYSDVNEI